MNRDPRTTYKIMSSVKSKDTKPERILGRAIWKLGLRYRKHYKLIGKPDFVFVKAGIAVFCDGDFWHGNNWRIRNLGSLDNELENYSEFWRNKILRNIERDKKVNDTLKKEGWTVIRFWESDIKHGPDKCAKKVLNLYQRKTNSFYNR